MGYFHMANLFFRQNKMDIANSLYAKVGKAKGYPLSIYMISQVLLGFFRCFSHFWLLLIPHTSGYKESLRSFCSRDVWPSSRVQTNHLKFTLRINE